jgi:hypothetical protein
VLTTLADLDGLPLEVSLKCDADLAEALRSQHAAIRAGYHLNKRHWNTVTLDGSIDDERRPDVPLRKSSTPSTEAIVPRLRASSSAARRSLVSLSRSTFL